MKTILVAIDFSMNSEHALQYALMFAKKLESSIYLVWVDNTISEETVFDTIKGDIRIEGRSYLTSLIDKYNSELENGEIKILLRKGKVYQEIAKAAKKIDADLIFAGTHGVSGYEQHWIGSNTFRIVTQAPCPVVTIRSAYDFKPGPKNILLPLDSSPETKEKLPYICEMANLFGAKVHLLQIYNTSLSVVRKRIDKYGEDAQSCLVKQGVDYSIDKLNVTNVAASIIDYSKNNEIDLIAIMTEQDNTTANRLLGPFAQQLINNSTIPIISVRARHIK